MAAPPLMRSLSTRSVKKLEKPRPLKISSSQSKVGLVQSDLSPHAPLQDLMILVESASQSLLDKNYDEKLISNIAIMHSKLKIHGQQLEAIFKGILNSHLIEVKREKQNHESLALILKQGSESLHNQLDRAFVVFRNGCQDDGLLCTTRLHLLELVELRANQWSNCDTTQVYYSAKMAASDIEPLLTTPDVNTSSLPVSAPSPPIPPVLNPGEVLKTSGKFSKPTKIPGKNYCKDEVVIRNSDSGKVMGIKGRRVHMIEEISETIISFQREFMRPLIIKSPVTWNSARYLYPPHLFRPSYHAFWPPRPGFIVNPGAKERLVQITGPSEDKIIHAKQLMEETIRRNASPVREGGEQERMGGSSSSLNSSASDESNRLTQPGSRRSALLHSFSTNDASIGEYKYTVTLGNETIKITGTNHETVRNARFVLEDYYNTWLQKNCSGDCYEINEDVFVDPIAEEMNILRLNSVDSGNGNGPSTSSGDSDDITCISTIPVSEPNIDQGLGYQPLFTISQPERRAVLGRSNSIPLPVPANSQSEVAVSRKYSRDFLIECALSHHSRVTPPNWGQVIAECPAIAKKAMSPFDPRAFARQVGSSSSIISLTQVSNEADSD